MYQVADYLRQLEADDSDHEGEQDNHSYNVFIQPPDVEYDSGGDDANENVGDVQLDQLHFNQFNQIIDLDLPVLEGEEELYEEIDQEMADEEPSTSAAGAPSAIRTSTSFSAPAPNTKWAYVGKYIDIPSKESCPGVSTKFKYQRQGTKLNATMGGIFPTANYQDCAVPAHELFERFFDDELCQMIVDCTNEYAVFQNAVNPNITVNELRVFMGILLISGYNVISDREDYWSQGTDMHNPMISAAMSRQRFRTISRFLHFSRSADENRHDKMWKLRPLMMKLIANFVKNFRPEQHLSYDESMVAYYGPHSCKQFLREKPTRYGYKVWCINTPSGYLLSFEVYQGNNPYIHPHLGRNYGRNVAPLLQMILNLPDNLRILPFCFYFDNLFTNIAMLTYLKSLGYHGTGTCRDNFLPRNLPIMKKKDMKKSKERGYMESTIIKDYDISITTWRDNNAVTVASTLFDRYPDGTCERFSLKDMGYIPLPRPNVIAMYNKYMGGVDRMDQNIGFYRIGEKHMHILFAQFSLYTLFFSEIRKNKWWWALWTWCLDVAVQNAWVQQRHSNMSNVTHLQFRRNIATYYCTQLSLKIQYDQTQRRFNKDNDARLDGLEHWVVPCNRRHCAYYRCKSQARTKCEKCDVGLCVKCFKPYHNTTN